MTFPQLLSAIHLALASALGLLTLNEPQLFVCSNFKPKSKAGVAWSSATVHTPADLMHVYTGEVYAPYSNDPGPAALNSSYRCCVRLCKVQLHHALLHNAACAQYSLCLTAACQTPASFINQVSLATASWSGERCLLLRVPQCGNGLSQLTTPSQNVQGELPPKSLLYLAQQQHESPVSEQGVSHPGGLLLTRAETISPRRDPLPAPLCGKLCQATCSVSEPSTHLTNGVPMRHLLQVVVASPAQH